MSCDPEAPLVLHAVLSIMWYQSDSSPSSIVPEEMDLSMSDDIMLPCFVKLCEQKGSLEDSDCNMWRLDIGELRLEVLQRAK